MNDADRLDLPTIGPEGLDEVWDDIRERGHYDRAGNAISMRDWARLRQFGGIEYMVVRQEYVDHYWVSTVWLGLDHGFGFGLRPVIIETMVFARALSHREPSEWFPKGYDYHEDFDQRRYCTEEEALAGHEAVVAEILLLAAATDTSDVPAES